MASATLATYSKDEKITPDVYYCHNESDLEYESADSMTEEPALDLDSRYTLVDNTDDYDQNQPAMMVSKSCQICWTTDSTSWTTDSATGGLCCDLCHPVRVENRSTGIDILAEAAFLLSQEFNPEDDKYESREYEWPEDNQYKSRKKSSKRKIDDLNIVPLSSLKLVGGSSFEAKIHKHCNVCHVTSSSRWVGDKSADGFICFNCYQKRNRTGSFIDRMQDGTSRQRKCKSCAVVKSSRWHKASKDPSMMTFNCNGCYRKK